jgi:hypothetical protein
MRWIRKRQEALHSMLFGPAAPPSPHTPWLVATSAVLATLATIVLFLWAAPPLYARIAIVVIAVCIVSFSYVKNKIVRTALVLTGFLSLVITITIAIINVPTEVEKNIDSLFKMTREANIWAQEPFMYEGSKRKIADHYDAFDPTRWHALDELPEVVPASIQDLIERGAATNNGALIVTAGAVTVQQEFGGQYIFQLEPIDKAKAEEITAELSTFSEINPNDAAVIVGGGIADPEHSHLQVYCLVTARPFFQAEQGSHLIVTGTPIAYGRIPRRDGRQNDVVYLLCSSVEHVNWPE